MSTIWAGAVAAAASAYVAFTLDEATGAVAGVTAAAGVTFTPDPGFGPLQGAFNSSWAPPGAQPADVPAAWADAAPGLLILQPGHSYRMIVEETS